jgi:hypothetical protein
MDADTSNDNRNSGLSQRRKGAKNSQGSNHNGFLFGASFP